MKPPFIIVREPGCTPELKQWHGAHGLRDMLRELVDCRPLGTQLTIIENELFEVDGVSVQCGREWLLMHDRRWAKKSERLYAHCKELRGQSKLRTV